MSRAPPRPRVIRIDVPSRSRPMPRHATGPLGWHVLAIINRAARAFAGEAAEPRVRRDVVTVARGSRRG